MVPRLLPAGGVAAGVDEGLVVGSVVEDVQPAAAIDGDLRVALVYARRDAAGWQKTSLGPARTYHSLALDPFGNPAVAYRDDLTGDARLTYVPAEVREVFAPIIRR